MTKIEAILAEYDRKTVIKDFWNVAEETENDISSEKIRDWLKSKLTSFEKEIREDERKRYSVLLESLVPVQNNSMHNKSLLKLLNMGKSLSTKEEE